MGTMLNLGKELLRIDPNDSRKLQYSRNGGRGWMTRYPGHSSTGDFQDLADNGNEILATTSRGLFYAKKSTGGSAWTRRS